MRQSTRQILRNIHPGEVLREEFLVLLGISQYRLAKEFGAIQKLGVSSPNPAQA